jgi:hypothetical protein
MFPTLPVSRVGILDALRASCDLSENEGAHKRKEGTCG